MMEELAKGAADRSYAKCESSDEFAARHLRFLYILPVRWKSAWRFSFGDIDFRPLSFEHGALLLSARVKGSRYLGANFRSRV